MKRRWMALSGAMILLSLGALFRAGEGTATAAEEAGPRTYAGSRACAECHAAEFAAWSRSAHGQLVKAADPHTVLGDFGIEKTIVLDGLRLRFLREGEGFAVEIEDPTGARRYPVEATLGNYSLQAYLARFPDGSLGDLPVVWDVQRKRWIGAATDPRSGASWTSRTWEEACARCHTVPRAVGGESREILEFGVGCESCHGPGADHVRTRRAGGEDAYADPASWSARARRDLCASCHVPDIVVPEDWLPGADLPDAVFLRGSAPVRGTLTPRHWPDGSERVPFASVGTSSAPQGYHGSRGECLDCHLPHGGNGFGALKASSGDNALCSGCHEDVAADLTAHTGHRPVGESRGSLCVECHMPRTNTHYSGLLAEHDLRSHEMTIPDPERTVVHGMPDACFLCHVDGSPEWALDRLDRWRAAREDNAGAGPR